MLRFLINDSLPFPSKMRIQILFSDFQNFLFKNLKRENENLKLKQTNLTVCQMNIITILKVGKGRRKSRGKMNPSNLYLTIIIQSGAGLGKRDLQSDPEFFHYVYYNDIRKHSKTILDVLED